LRDYGFRIKRTEILSGTPIIVASDRNMMSKAAFKIKILKGGYKSKLDEQEIVSEKSKTGFMGIGLVDDDVIQKMQNKFSEIEGKFIAL